MQRNLITELADVLMASFEDRREVVAGGEPEVPHNDKEYEQNARDNPSEIAFASVHTVNEFVNKAPYQRRAICGACWHLALWAVKSS